MLEKIKKAVSYIQQRTDYNAVVGIILGTGLGSLVKEMTIHHKIAYKDIPHFPISTVESHSGQLILGELSGKKVVAMQGRFHYYEGYSMQQVTFPVRVMKMLGITHLFICNAAGGLDPAYKKGDLMFIKDHINLQYENPLVGTHTKELGDRFPDMSEPYDLSLLHKAKQIAKSEQIRVHEGIYVGVPGPNLETKAEYNYLRLIGSDAVGMSTVSEVIVAVQSHLKIFAVAAITDLCSPGKIVKANIPDILAAAAAAEPKMTLIIKDLVKLIDD